MNSPGQSESICILTSESLCRLQLPHFTSPEARIGNFFSRTVSGSRHVLNPGSSPVQEMCIFKKRNKRRCLCWRKPKNDECIHLSTNLPQITQPQHWGWGQEWGMVDKKKWKSYPYSTLTIIIIVISFCKPTQLLTNSSP